MSGTRVILLTLAGVVGVTTAARAQVPDGLHAAMRARDSAFFKADVAAWDRFTAASFTTVQQDGSMMTKAERIAHLKTQSPKPFVARSREQIRRYGDVYVVRFLSGDLWVLEVWSQENGAWKSVASQVTTAKKQSRSMPLQPNEELKQPSYGRAERNRCSKSAHSSAIVTWCGAIEGEPV